MNDGSPVLMVERAETYGWEPELDFPLPTKPQGEAAFGENHAFWFFDEAGGYYINVHIESVGQLWAIRHEAISICLPDGRILVDMTEGWNTGPDVVGGAYVKARCVEPFRRWTIEAAGTMLESTQEKLTQGPLGSARRVLVSWEATIDCPAPPYRTGSSDNDAAQGNGTNIASVFMGGLRYEQLFRADVVLRIEGEPEVRFRATGDRTHRRGPRDLKAFSGHDWKACLFPDGSGFNTHRYRTPEGEESWSEAFLIREGRVIPARIVEDSWITGYQTKGEPLYVRLKSELGETVIEGETLGGTFRPAKAARGDPHARRFGVYENDPDALVLSQSWARYRLGNQVANGLLERSSPDRFLRR